MEPSKKTTILFPRDLHRHLGQLAEQLDMSLGELVRRACEREYGRHELGSKRAAGQVLHSLELPVSTPEQMKRESVAVKS